MSVTEYATSAAAITAAGTSPYHLAVIKEGVRVILYTGADIPIKQTYPPVYDRSEYALLLQQEARRSKGGVIGVGPNVGVIALRFDDWQNAFKATFLPLLQARGVPASMALISEFSSAVWGNTTTWNDIRNFNQYGVEIWNHGKDHNDYIGYAGLYANIVTAKETIEAQGLKVQGFALPGTTPIYTTEQRGNAIAYNSLSQMADYNSAEGDLIMQTHALSEAYGSGNYREMPNWMYHGSNHVTLNLVTLAAAKANVDYAIATQTCLRFMTHAGEIDTGGGNMSLTDWTAFLDYCVTKRDAGLLEFLTPSGLCFADRSTQRVDLLRGGNFLGIDNTTPGLWNNIGTGATNRTYQTGGPSGGPYLEIATSGPNQRPQYLSKRGFAGETFQFTGWCKSLGASTTNARLLIQEYPTPTNLNIDKTISSVGNGSWQRVDVAFTIPASADTIMIFPHRLGGDATGWANISVKKV